jgi:nucleoside-diphosphate-sugar epimerase
MNLSGRRVLVTGASGFLGSGLVRRLISANAVVAGLARHRRGQEESRFYPCDVTDAEAVRHALTSFQPEALVHFAAHADAAESFQQARDAVSRNLVGTLNVLEAFRLSGGSLFIYGDSSKVYGDSDVPYRESMPLRPLSSYAIAKAAGWELCRLYARLYGLHCVSVRPTMVYGPGQSFNLISFVAKRILDGAPQVLLDGGSQTRDPLFIEDAIDAFVAVLRQGKSLSGRVVNLGGGHERTVEEIAAMVARLMQSSISIVCVAGRKRPTDMQRSYCDNYEAESLIGWKPKQDLAEGLKRTLSALVKEHATNTAA